MDCDIRVVFLVCVLGWVFWFSGVNKGFLMKFGTYCTNHSVFRKDFCFCRQKSDQNAFQVCNKKKKKKTPAKDRRFLPMATG